VNANDADLLLDLNVTTEAGRLRPLMTDLRSPDFRRIRSSSSG
jgi:hypothetical protein